MLASLLASPVFCQAGFLSALALGAMDAARNPIPSVAAKGLSVLLVMPVSLIGCLQGITVEDCLFRNV
jgi:hypothetical protein